MGNSQLAPLVNAIKDGKKITFFVGAGISTSCGIPDFRSPKTGLYANLKRLNLPYPEAVFDIDYFKDSPKAFCTLCHELYPGKFLPSKFHFLMKLVQDKGLLQRVYTQNIDTLESLAGVEEDKIVAAHGSFAANHCIDCGAEMSTEKFSSLINNTSTNEGIPRCEECNGYVKPDIVFFGEGLPERFFDSWEEDGDDVEVAIVAGTSLTVYPFAALPAECGRNALRVLINKEVVGDFKSGKRKTDLTIQSDCDSVATELAEALGWAKDLQRLVEAEQAKFAAKTQPKPESKEPKIESKTELEPKTEPEPKSESKAEEPTEKSESKTEKSETKEPKKDSSKLAHDLAEEIAHDMQEKSEDSVVDDLKKLSI